MLTTGTSIFFVLFVIVLNVNGKTTVVQMVQMNAALYALQIIIIISYDDHTPCVPILLSYITICTRAQSDEHKGFGGVKPTRKPQTSSLSCPASIPGPAGRCTPRKIKRIDGGRRRTQDYG